VPKSRIDNLRIISGKGHSMSPTFNDGDLILVDTGVRIIDVDGVYVLSANGRLYIKTVRQRMDGQFEVSSDNPAVKTVDVLNGEHEVAICGRVVWAWNGRKL
jgi:phage repressor protein C with HTH and peptisase S24 domain